MSVLFRDGDPVVVEASFLIPHPVYGRFLSYGELPKEKESVTKDISIIIDCASGKKCYYYSGYLRLATETEILLYF